MFWQERVGRSACNWCRSVAAGHEVHGMTRTASKQAMLQALGAVPVVADALNPDQVAEAVARAKPDVIVHELTAIGALDTRHFDRDFAATNRLRTEGTDHLLSAGHAMGVRRFVAQSISAFGMYARVGGPVKSEDDPLETAPAREMRETLAAIRHLEDAVLGADWTEGIVLRYGAFYGPGTSLAPGEGQFELVRSAGSRSSATVPVCGRSSISRTRPRPRRRQSSAGRVGPTTSSTTNRPPLPRGCLRSLRISAPSGRCTCPVLSGASLRGRPARG